MNNPRVDLLTTFPWLKRLLRARAFQPALMLVTLLGFTVVIISGLFGTPVGNRSFAIIFVWIVWWALLIMVMVPFFGRFWCAMCPIPAPGEWMQRRNIIASGKLHTLNRRWPRRLKNMWLQNIGFLGVAIFSMIILTRPQVTGWLLLGFILAGVILSVVYKNRVFCRYVCPVGGFIGLYSMMAPLELRVRDTDTCLQHKTKDCVTGNADGYGCPWMTYPGNLTRNVYCGLCMECLKTCPHDNIVINWRPAGSDLLEAKGRSLDEAYKAFIMLSCALLYSAVLLGPWGWLKNWANMETLPHWVAYALGFLLVNLLVLPGSFWLTAALARRMAGQQTAQGRLFVDYAYTLVPLGLAAWIAFSLGFALVNGSYALGVISDPFGWGWNLLGTANSTWSPFLTPFIPFLQVGILTAGLLFAIQTAYRIARQHSISHERAIRATLPLSGYLLAITLGFLWLYMG